MLVYRLCNDVEINLALNNRFGEIGFCFDRNPANDHDYMPNINYMHFYRNKGAMFYFGIQRNPFICTYDIPDDILAAHEGIGYYRNYLYSHIQDKVTEYAIQSELIDFGYLIKVQRVINDFEPEDYFEDIELNDFLETIYEKEKVRVR